jgi:hypothetical protein
VRSTVAVGGGRSPLALGNEMKKLGLAVLSVIALCVAAFVLSFFGTHESLTTSNVGERFTLTAKDEPTRRCTQRSPASRLMLAASRRHPSRHGRARMTSEAEREALMESLFD